MSGAKKPGEKHYSDVKNFGLGTQVVFYKRGSLLEDNPALGWITRYDPRTHSVGISFLPTVYGIPGQFVEGRPFAFDDLILKKPDIAVRRGCWDLLENHLVRVAEREQERRALAKKEIQSKKEREERLEFERMVVMLAGDGKSLDEISKELSTAKGEIQKVLLNREVVVA